MGLVCSSYVTISQGTHCRAPWNPLGRQCVHFVKVGNELTSRYLFEKYDGISSFLNSVINRHACHKCVIFEFGVDWIANVSKPIQHPNAPCQGVRFSWWPSRPVEAVGYWNSQHRRNWCGTLGWWSGCKWHPRRPSVHTYFLMVYCNMGNNGNANLPH